MRSRCPKRAAARLARHAVLVAAATGALAVRADSTQTVRVEAAGFSLGTNHVVGGGTNRLDLALASDRAIPFCQSAVKQSMAPAAFGPNPQIPYFTVRFALPIPPENLTNNFAALTGMDPEVFTHNHSPGFEILPNGDALAIYFSTPPGKAEADPETSFVQARLRYGSEEWDMPELFFKTENFNDQSGLLWRDGNKIWFFGGGRDFSDDAPFKIATSADNGATWTLSLPQLAKPAENYTAQPITSAFRGDGHSIFFAMDGEKATSFLWRSDDDGVHWRQLPGRTGGRHSVIVPLDDKGDLLSIGGKNASVNGWSPENTSTNWGESWSASVASPFPPLGTAQRPSLIRLASGNLLYVGESYLHKADKPAPPDWKFGDRCFVALSTNNGAAWHIKPLPVELPGHERTNHPTLGYVTARQAPNGVIHILTTITQPCLHYELNEAWIRSDAGDVTPEITGGTVKKISETYPDGKVRSEWTARICANGRFLLDGKETDFYPNGAKQHQAIYASGCKTGDETFWAADGKRIWTWSHDLKMHHSVWTQYWPNGKKKIESVWNTRPTARDLKREFFGYVADGPAKSWSQDGSLQRSGNFSNGLFMEEGRQE